MITAIAAALVAEQTEGNAWAEQMIERIDRHIRDFEMTKAWIRDSAKLRSDAIDSLIGGAASPIPAGAPLPAVRDREAAEE